MVSDTKTALMDIAEHAARSRGVDGFSYADLAGAIGIRKASVHYHFPTKDDLAKALVERYQAKLRAECNAIDAVHATGGARLRPWRTAKKSACVLPFPPAAKACPSK